MVQGCVLIYKQRAVYICMGGYIYMPAVYTDTCIWVHVHGCVYRIIGMCASLCLFLNRCQTQETRKNRK